MTALLLAGGRIADVERGRLGPPRDLLIVDGVIARIGGRLPNADERIDVSGLALLPGLIDLHTHLLLHPYSEISWNDQVLKESCEFRTVRAVAAARATLEAGFTTVRDLGTEGAGWADVALRDGTARGLIEGPRVVTTTRAIVATGCYGPLAFDPRAKVPKGAQEADGADGVRRAAREQIAAGAEWIKVYADYPRRPGEAATPTFSLEELRAAVDEARSAGRPVASHAVTDEAIRRSVKAGVSTIEHGTGASLDTLREMRDRGVALCPTLAAAEALAMLVGWKEGRPEHPRIAGPKEMFRRALRSGVTIGCGSDAGVFAHGQNVREIELMSEWGMGPAGAIRAATATAADILGWKNVGRLAVGGRADLIGVGGNPFTDLAALRSPRLVVKAGRIVRSDAGTRSR